MGALKSGSSRSLRVLDGGSSSWWGLILGLVATTACGRPPSLPPPVYEHPELPPWEPPATESKDPLESLDDLEGEWVDEEPPESPQAEDQPPEDDPAPGAQEGSEPEDSGGPDSDESERPQE